MAWEVCSRNPSHQASSSKPNRTLPHLFLNHQNKLPHQLPSLHLYFLFQNSPSSLNRHSFQGYYHRNKHQAPSKHHHQNHSNKHQKQPLLLLWALVSLRVYSQFPRLLPKKKSQRPQQVNFSLSHNSRYRLSKLLRLCLDYLLKLSLYHNLNPRGRKVNSRLKHRRLLKLKHLNFLY